MRPNDRSAHRAAIQEGHLTHAEQRQHDAEQRQYQEKQRQRVEQMRRLVSVFKVEIEQSEFEKEDVRRQLEKQRKQYAVAKKVAREFIHYKKREYSNAFWLSARQVALLFPRDQLEKAQRRLRGGRGKTFEQKILDRIIILPQKKYLKLQGALEQNESNGIWEIGLIFVSEKVLKKESAFRTVAHEVSHLADYFAGMRRSVKGREAIGEARSLFAVSVVSRHERRKAMERALTVYKSSKSSEAYLEGINLGRQVFLFADELRKKSGIVQGERFIREVARHKIITRQLVESLHKRMLAGNIV